MLKVKLLPAFARKAVIPLFLCLLSGPVLGFDKSNFIDPEDGKLDMSKYLSEVPMGFLPVPIVITEPAVGFGLGMGAIFFHETDEQKKLRTSGVPIRPNNLTILGGGATENGTWGVGGGQIGYWREDTIRYKGFLGYASVNLDFYSLPGIGDLPKPIELNMKGPGVLQQLMFRLHESKFFMGFRQFFRKADTSFANLNETPILPPAIADYLEKQLDTSTSTLGLGVVAEYDSRDNPFNPQAGFYYAGNYMVFDKAIGSDVDYDSFELTALNYWNLGKRFDLGLRFQADGVNATSNQRLPPYVPPYIDLRGVSAGRYQGERVVVAEAQLYYKLNDRWKIGLFSGLGRAADSVSDLSSAENVVTYGTGFRYMIARRYGFVTGIDIAKGPNEAAFYIQTGATWR